MTKTILKTLGMFLLLLVVAAVSWLASYTLTKRSIGSNPEQAVQTYKTVDVFAEDKEIEQNKSVTFEYYIVRLEGDSLNVYTCADNSEEFLYSESIITANLTKMDLELLSRGTVLYSTSELTEFMENFVS